MANNLYNLTRGITLIFTAVILSNPLSSAQVDKTAGLDQAEIEKQKAIQSTIMPKTEKVLLDKIVNPETYILGPGDVLSVFTWGNYEGQYTLTVSPEGMLLIPAVGPVEVSGQTLKDAAGKISSNILERFRNVEVVVSLANLRSFKVFIGGAVKYPGAYPATPVTRVSEIIELAGGFLGSKENDENYQSDFRASVISDKKASKRNILVINQTGDSLKADLLKFEVAGQTENNPRLNDGDKIFVPLRDLGINLYGIFGAVKNPGYFEYSENDSLDDIIELAHGLTLDADSQNTEIIRFKPDNKQTYSIEIDLTAPDWNCALRADDRVYIKEIQDYHQKYQVHLIGEFKFPGYYPIVQDSTLLSEVVEKAGGFTDLASLQEAEMFRISEEEVIDPEFERLKNMEVADMSESEYEYFKMKSRSKPGRVSVDFWGLFVDGDNDKNFVLRDGDEIRVPRKSKVINIIGEVANPGILPYVQGEDYRYYVQRAGGYSDRARKRGVSVINGITGEWKKADKGKSLESGDTIWIAEKKKRDYWGFIKDTLIFVGNLATVYLVIQQATK